MSDDRDSNVVQLPSRGDRSGSMPEAPNIDGLFYTEPPEEPPALPPESPEETTMELPPIPRPMNPEMALASEGFPAAPGIDDGVGENSDGEYVQRRSLAERIGDWLEYRIAVGQARMEGEAPYKEAEIARKVELLNARTAREVGLLEQQNKLRQAQVQARTARAAAQGKGEASGSKSGGRSGGGSSASGLGRDKGGRKPTSSGSSGSGKPGGGSGKGPSSGRGTGTNNSGGAGSRGKSNASGGGNSPKGPGKGPGDPSGGRNGAGKGKDSPRGSRGLQNSPGGSRNSGGSGKGGSTGNGGRKDRKQDPKRSGPTPELPRNRQERKGARQTARQQRRAADQAAALTDRSKDRDQARGNQQADHEERRRKKAERAKAKADRVQAKRTREEAKQQEEEAKRQKEGTKSSGRTTLGQAVGEEAQRRWDKRRSQESVKPEAAGESKAEAGPEGKSKDVPTEGTKPPKSGPAGAADPSGPGGSAKGDGAPSGGSDAGAGGTPKGWTRKFRRRRDGTPKGGPDSGSTPSADGPGWPGNREESAEWVGREGRKQNRPASDEEYIPDAEVITRSLPPAPEPHTERPGTSRLAEEESNVGSTKPPASNTGGLAAQHRTNVTFDEYLVEIANVALASGSDKDEAKAIATVTGKIADRLREMATDLGNDHNIETRIIDLISDLADAAARMQQQAERCAENCEIAADAAGLAAVGVARTYREDLDAMDAGGVTHASAAAHH